MGLLNVREWWSQSQPRPPQMPGPLDGPEMQSAWWQSILASQDGLSSIIAVKEQHRSHNLLLGGVGGELLFSHPDTSMLVLGPPRSIGKTAGVMVPNVLVHRGPAVVVSTKPDLAVATALHRRRQGRVLQFSPDGSDLMPGFEPLRWSPISDDWGDCLARAQWMVQASSMAGDTSRENGTFWQQRAASLLAVTLFYAGITGRPMEWVVEIINDGQPEVFRPLRDEFVAQGHVMAAKVLTGIVTSKSVRTTGDIFATASVILAPYLLPEALAVTEDPNFDVAQFVVGRPNASNDLLMESRFNGDMVDGATRQLIPTPWKKWLKQSGVFDTIYISCSEENMALVAPLIIGFLGDIRRAVLKQNRQDELAGMGKRAPVLWAIDELANVPIPDLPKILADGGSQNLLILGALQTLEQAHKWGDMGKALPTLFNNLLVLPGTRSDDLDLWSKLIGQFDQEVWGGSHSGRGKDREWNANQSFQRRNKLDPSDIYHGNPHDPDAALLFQSNTWLWCSLQLYYRTHLWPVMLQMSAEFACRNEEIAAQGLPYPELARNGDWRFLQAIDPDLATEYHDARNQYYANLRSITA